MVDPWDLVRYCRTCGRHPDAGTAPHTRPHAPHSATKYHRRHKYIRPAWPPPPSSPSPPPPPPPRRAASRPTAHPFPHACSQTRSPSRPGLLPSASTSPRARRLGRTSPPGRSPRASACFPTARTVRRDLPCQPPRGRLSHPRLFSLFSTQLYTSTFLLDRVPCLYPIGPLLSAFATRA